MSRVWLITDAARGLGRTLAEAVLRTGARVVACARDPGRLAALARCHGARLRIVGLDVADEASIYAAIDEALAAFGRIDVVVNAAGRIDVVVNAAGRSDGIANGEMSDADLRARFETDFFGLAAVAHAALPILREQRGGRFVQLVAHGDDADNAADRAAQTALRAYLEALGREVARDGVDIGIIEPGATLAETIGRPTADASHRKPSARVVRLPARPEAA